MFKTDNRCKVTVETPDGRMFESTAFIITESHELVDVSSYSHQHKEYIPGYVKTTIEVQLLDSLGWVSKKSWIQSAKERASAMEWFCDYCHRPNRRRDEICKSCGAVRSFIYG